MACLFVSYASLNGENVRPTLLLSPRVERWVFLLYWYVVDCSVFSKNFHLVMVRVMHVKIKESSVQILFTLQSIWWS